MASSKRKHTDADGEITVKAVLAYAARLRDRADAAKAGDPHVELYRPSNDAARKVSQEFGPAQALEVLATRARRVELRYEEAEKFAGEGRLRLVTHQTVAQAERTVDRERLSLGQRLDVALKGLGVLSEVSAVQLDADIVSGSKGGGALPFRPRREVEHLQADAEHLVTKAERELERSRRRVVEQEAA